MPLGKMRKEQSGDANETEKVAMMISARSSWVLQHVRSRPDLSGPVSILQSRLNSAQVSDIQETNRVLRLAKAHTDLALPCLQDSCGSNLFGVLRWMPVVGGIHAEQAQTAYVIMLTDMSLLQDGHLL